MAADLEARKHNDMRDVNMMTLLYANLGALERQVAFDHRVKTLPAPYPPQVGTKHVQEWSNTACRNGLMKHTVRATAHRPLGLRAALARAAAPFPPLTQEHFYPKVRACV